MLIFIIIYFCIALFSNLVNISLLKGSKMQFLALVIPSIIALLFYDFSLNQNNKTLDYLLAQVNLVGAIAIIQTFEALLGIFLTTVQIKSYYNPNSWKLWKWISLFPSVQFLLGLVFCQTFMFLKIDGYSFLYLALFMFLAGILLQILLVFTLQKVVSKWSLRAELKALTLLFQLLLAMFLPLIANGTKASFSQITIEPYPMLICGIIVFIGTGIGYLKFKNKNKLI